MTTKELKSKIIKDLNEINDEDLLLILNTIIENSKSEPLIISDKRKKILDNALKQIKNGEYYADEEINSDEKEWLKE